MKRDIVRGHPIYGVSASFDTHHHLLGWFPDPDEAEKLRAAMQVHHNQKPEQPAWLILGLVELQAVRTALTEWGWPSIRAVSMPSAAGA